MSKHDYGFDPNEKKIEPIKRDEKWYLHVEYRQRNLPKQIQATRAKLKRLQEEAVMLGMPELVVVNPNDCIEVEHYKKLEEEVAK